MRGPTATADGKSTMWISMDIWGTILDLEAVTEEMAQGLSRLLGKDEGTVERTIHAVREKLKRLRRVGAIGAGEMVSRGLEELGRELEIDVGALRSAVEKVFEAEVDVSRLVFNDVSEALDILHARGHRLGVLGNVLLWPGAYTRTLLERAGLSKYFEFMLFADEIGFQKPEREAFIKFCERAGVAPEDVVHVGDSVAEDVGGPLSVGMKAVLIDRRGGTLLVLRDFGIAVIHDLRLLPFVADALIY
ncbi:MAG: HAD family hydrolase [Desulfurococcaceae archaeon]